MAEKSFEQEFLDRHNAYRAAHGAPPLTLSDKLSSSAQRWANYLLQIGQMQHSSMGVGENIYSMWGSSPAGLTGKEAVDAWYNEIKDYNYHYPGFRFNTGHFTQVVWKSSTELGVGIATDGYKVFVVGQYLPPGNYANQFEHNVLPKESEPVFDRKSDEEEEKEEEEENEEEKDGENEEEKDGDESEEEVKEDGEEDEEEEEDGEENEEEEDGENGDKSEEEVKEDGEEGEEEEEDGEENEEEVEDGENGDKSEEEVKEDGEEGEEEEEDGENGDKSEEEVKGEESEETEEEEVEKEEEEEEEEEKEKSFEQEFLDRHNAYRAAHGAPPLTLSDKLSSSAQRWANYLLQIGQMQHSSMGVGENIYSMWGSSPAGLTGKEAVDAWYNEIKDYNYHYPGFRFNTGHFTQVVWKSSTELGVGIATDGYKVFVVGQYLPPGNYANQFEHNVLPKGS